jgi:hypothetical protein
MGIARNGRLVFDRCGSWGLTCSCLQLALTGHGWQDHDYSIRVAAMNLISTET